MTVPASALDLRDGTWLMTGSCVMKDSAIVKENYGHSLDRLQVCFSWTVANWHSLMVNEPDEPWSGHVFLFFFFRKSSGEQLDSMVWWVYSLKHHIWRHTCGGNKKSGAQGAARCLWRSYHILTSSVIYYWADPRQYGIFVDVLCNKEAKLSAFPPYIISKN